MLLFSTEQNEFYSDGICTSHIRILHLASSHEFRRMGTQRIECNSRYILSRNRQLSRLYVQTFFLDYSHFPTLDVGDIVKMNYGICDYPEDWC